MYSFSFFNLVMRIWPSFLLSYVSFLLRSVPWLSFVGVEHTRCGLRFNKVMVANHVFRMSGFSSHLGISSKWAENSPQSYVRESCCLLRSNFLNKEQLIQDFRAQWQWAGTTQEEGASNEWAFRAFGGREGIWIWQGDGGLRHGTQKGVKRASTGKEGR